MKKFRLYSFFVLAFLAAGLHAWAEDITVKYVITSGVAHDTDSYTLTFGLADGSATPYGGFNPVSVTVNKSSATDQTVTLGDGFSLRLQWAQGTNILISDAYGWNLSAPGGQITYTVKCSSPQYFVRSFSMKNNSGNTGMSDNGNHPMEATYNNYAYMLEQSYNAAASFGRLEITYTKEPPLSALTSPSANTYNITSKHDLAVLAAYVNNNSSSSTCSGLTFLQTDNITCDNTYTPIGNSSHAFCGTYDGGGHAIFGITVNRTGNTDSDKFIGVFGSLSSGGHVEKVVLMNCNFAGNMYVGGIVGKMTDGKVKNCRVNANIKAGSNSAQYFGGIVGYQSGGYIEGCVSAAGVTDNSKNSCTYFGGIVGSMSHNAALINSLYTGSMVFSTTTAKGLGSIAGVFSAGILKNNYYTNTERGATGISNDNTSSDRAGARRARTVTLGDGISIKGIETPYDITGLTGLTAIGTLALRYGSAIYSGANQNLTLLYTETPSEGYHIEYHYNDGEDHVLPGNELIMPDANVTVSTNGIVPNTYTIHFNANLGSGTMADQVFTYDEGQNLTANTFSRESYFFSGWNTYSGGGGDSYQDKQTVNNLTTVNGKTITLYAQWTPDLSLWHADADHDGSSAEKAYIISTTQGLDLLASEVNEGNNYNETFFELGADITYSYENLPDNKSNFTAIGKANNRFKGVFDGKNFTISGIRIREDRDNQGLFGNLSGTVKNITLTDTEINSKNSNYAGGIAGEVYGGIIDGCLLVSNSIQGVQYCGGIVGDLTNKGTISNCLVLDTEIRSSNAWSAIITGDDSGVFDNNFYYNCNYNGEPVTNKGTRYGDADGARAAVKYDSRPERIGAQTATYPNGLTVYEYGLAYDGSYYLDNRLDGEMDVNLTLTRGTKDGVTAWWGTYYNEGLRFTLPEGAQAFTMGSDKHLYRLGTDGRTIPEATAVVIISDKQTITLTVDGGKATITDNSGGNILMGQNGDSTPSSASVLGIVNGAIDFYKVQSGTTIPGHKAYY